MSTGRYHLSSQLGADPGATLHVHIVNGIRDMIRDGVLKDGEPLPSERELAEMFGVSRVPVREAVKILEFIGVLRRVRTKGLLVVGQIDPRQTMEQFNFLFVDTPASINEIYEVRQALEIQSTIAAAERRTPQDMMNIEEAWLRSDHYIKHQYDVSLENMRFHASIVQASHNSAMIRIFDFMYGIRFFSSRTNSVNSPERIVIAHAEHKEIMDSIRRQDAAEAGQLMRRHIDVSRIAVQRAAMQSVRNEAPDEREERLPAEKADLSS